MLVFVTAVRHPLNSRSWQRVGRLLDASLRSACRQTDECFEVIVVANELPPLEFEHPKLHSVVVTFPPPAPDRTSEIDFIAGIRDKGLKLAVGVTAAREMGADHVMFMDCDDLVHRGLAAFTNDRRDGAGWYSPQGYIHTAGSRYVHFVADGFHTKNGSTGIIRADLIPVPLDLAAASPREEILERMGESVLLGFLGMHGKWFQHVEREGHELERLPFPSAVWEIGTGENASGNLVSGRGRRLIDADVSEHFGLMSPRVLQSGVMSTRLLARRVARRVRTIASRS